MNKREIKFRAWIKDDDIPEGYMVNGVDNTFVNTRNGQYVIENYEGKIVKYNKDQYILMQYTGLKDKNGIEIYEGDILERQGVETWGENREARCVVEDIRHLNHIMFHDGFEIEIIGNIFEK